MTANAAALSVLKSLNTLHIETANLPRPTFETLIGASDDFTMAADFANDQGASASIVGMFLDCAEAWRAAAFEAE